MSGDFPVPRHYEMKGHNSLMGSHYDHYFISYQNFSPDKPANEGLKARVIETIIGFSVFDLFLSKSCHGWPGPGKASDHVYTMNPAKEFVDNHDAHVR